MKKLGTILCMALVLAFVFTACSAPAAQESASAETESSSATQAPEESASTEASESAEPAEASSEAADAGTGIAGKKLAIIGRSTGNPYVDKELSGFEEAVTEAGGEAITRVPEQPTVEGQIQIVDELLAQGVDSITIASNDVDALQPALARAMEQGVVVSAVDSTVNPESRQVFVNQAGTELIGESLVEAAYDMCDGEGEFAILSATSQAANQNAWIAAMEDLLESDSKYENLELVKIAYGDDLRDKSTSETEALLQSYPDLKCIVSPTTVGIAAAAKVLTDKDLGGTVALTGLGLPSEMAEYIDNGVCEYMFLWNPIDVGYLAGYTAIALTDGTITGAEGDQYSAGRLGDYTVIAAEDGGTEVILGPPFRFDASNINEWKDVY